MVQNSHTQHLIKYIVSEGKAKSVHMQLILELLHDCAFLSK